MKKELFGKEVASIIKNLISDHISIYFDEEDSSVTVGIITAAGDLVIKGTPHKFLATYNYRTKEISIKRFEKNATDENKQA